MSQLARGLGLLPDLVVDQHFRERDRYGRLLSLVAQSPSLLGVGIDEDTAAIVIGSVLEVAGRGAITIVDTANAVTSAPSATGSRPILVSGAVVHTLPSGARFDLSARALLPYEEDLPPAELAEIAATESGMRRLARRIAREDAAPPVRRRTPAGQGQTEPATEQAQTHQQ
jgi:cyanophycinase